MLVSSGPPKLFARYPPFAVPSSTAQEIRFSIKGPRRTAGGWVVAVRDLRLETAQPPRQQYDPQQGLPSSVKNPSYLRTHTLGTGNGVFAERAPFTNPRKTAL